MSDAALWMGGALSCTVTFLVGLLGAFAALLAVRRSLGGFRELCLAFAAGAFSGLGLFHIVPQTTDDFARRGLVLQVGAGTFNLVWVFLFCGYVLILFVSRVLVHTEEGLRALAQKGSVGDETEGVALQSAGPSGGALQSAGVQSAGINSAGIHSAEAQSAALQSAHSSGTADLEGAAIARDASFKTVDGPSNSVSEARARWANLNEYFYKQQRFERTSLFKSESFLLAVALGIHAVFEGVVIGTSGTLHAQALATAVIGAHKWAESFSLGSACLAARFPAQHICAIVLAFTACTPAGTVLGLALQNASGAFETAAAVLCALGGGTVLFASAELVEEAFENGDLSKAKKFLGFLGGATVVFAVTLADVSLG